MLTFQTICVIMYAILTLTAVLAVCLLPYLRAARRLEQERAYITEKRNKGKYKDRRKQIQLR